MNSTPSPPSIARSLSWPPGRHVCAWTVLGLLALFLLGKNLGAPALWADEGDTAVFAQAIVRSGVPSAWDGVTFTDSDLGLRLNDDLILVGTPWLPFYVTAASFGILGESTWTARLPFALAGLATIPCIYWLVRRYGLDPATAYSAALLTLFSVQFLVYSRQCRHYALNMLLTTLAVALFPTLDRRPAAVAFSVAVVLLFHCHPLPACALLAVLGMLTLVARPYRHLRRSFWTAVPVISLCTFPWLAIGWGGVSENSSWPTSPAEVGSRLLQAAIEFNGVVPLLGWLVLLPFAWRRIERSQTILLLVLGTVVATYAALLGISLSSNELWLLGVRYCCGLIPLGAAITAVLVAATAGHRVGLRIALLVAIATTHLGSETIPGLLNGGRFDVPLVASRLHPPSAKGGYLLRWELAGYACELFQTTPGTVTWASEELTRRALPDDIVITNYEWEPLYFHTRLPQGLKIMPRWPIYEAARRHNLPNSVFTTEDARWIVWRPAWAGYRDYNLAAIRTQLADQGRTLKAVDSGPETVWENRENLHFRRFPYFGLLYRSPPGWSPAVLSEAVLYRVDPDKPAR